MHRVNRGALDNAADASPQSVRLEADWTASTLNIRIHDSGAGLPETIQPLLGEIVGLTTKPDGMGLGLFLTRSVITRLEGKLTLTSIAGKGTTAHITLPLRRLTV